jgi:hypothetical protein
MQAIEGKMHAAGIIEGKLKIRIGNKDQPALQTDATSNSIHLRAVS